MDGLETAKRDLRRAARLKRGELCESPTGREGSLRIQERLLASPLWKVCRRVVLYVSVKGEPDTSLLLDAAWNSGREVFLPRCRSGEMDLTVCTRGTALRVSAFGIPEPELDAKSRLLAESELHGEETLLVVPGLAFDVRGFRLGYGGGYYDRLLSRASCPSAGLVSDALLMREVPRAVWDMPVWYICTETKLFSTGALPSCGEGKLSQEKKARCFF